MTDYMTINNSKWYKKILLICSIFFISLIKIKIIFYLLLLFIFYVYNRLKYYIYFGFFMFVNYLFMGLYSHIDLSYDFKFFLTLLVSTLVTILFLFEYKNYYFEKGLYYPIDYLIGKKNHHLTGYMDTGLLAYDDYPIVFIKGTPNKDVKPIKEVYLESINGLNKYGLYKPDKFYITISGKKEEKEVYLAYTKDVEFDSLLSIYIL